MNPIKPFFLPSVRLDLKKSLQDDWAQMGHWYPVALAGGIGLYCVVPSPTLECSAVILLWLSIKWAHKPKLPVVMLWSVAGILLTHYHAFYRGALFIPERVFLKQSGGVIRHIGCYEKGCFLAVQTQEGRLHLWHRTSHTHYFAGQAIVFSARLFPPQPSSPQHPFDEKWMAFWNGYRATGHITAIHDLHQHKPHDLFQTRIDHAVQQFRTPEIGQLWSKLIRAQGVISKSMRQTYAQSGLSHVLAVSGLHMTIVGGMLYFMLSRMLVLLFPWRWHTHAQPAAALICLPVLWLYAWQCWSAVSARRAVVLSSLVLLSRVYHKPHHSLRFCMLAGLFVLLVNPEALFSLGFQMSFMAVLTLVHENQRLHVSNARKSPSQTLWGNLRMTVKLTCVTTLYATALPDVQSLGLGVISNLWTIPYVTFVVMPLAFLTFMAALLGFQGVLWVTLCEYSLKGLNVSAATGAWLSQWLHVSLPKPSSFSILCVTISLLWGILWRSSWRRWNRWGLLIALVSLWIPCPQNTDHTQTILEHLTYMKKGPQGPFLLPKWKKAIT